jgi:Ca2+:H+ antiporter
MSRLSEDETEIDEDTALLPTQEDGEPNGRLVWYKILRESAKATYAALSFSKANILLICVPLGIMAKAYEWGDVPTFTLNFLAIFALASVLSYATDELSAKAGQTIGGLLNATFGNMVELLVRFS